LVGSENEVLRFDGEAIGHPVATVDMPDFNRTNDATVDAAGRLWFGTMDDRQQAPTGMLYCLDRGTLIASDWTAVVTNGPAFSCGGQFLYHVDSGERTVWRIPAENATVASAGDVFIRIADADGYPDGVVVDSEDCIWVALWDGWGVRRYAPDGTLLMHIDIPCARVTKIAFGGPDLMTAFVTTARFGIDQDALADQPLAGSLFAFTAPAPGRPLPDVVVS
jgi:xylono-1,5-lactonase